MTPKKPTVEQKLKHASPWAKDAFAYIDQGFAPGIGWDTILNGVLNVFGGNDERRLDFNFTFCVSLFAK